MKILLQHKNKPLRISSMHVPIQSRH